MAITDADTLILRNGEQAYDEARRQRRLALLTTREAEDPRNERIGVASRKLSPVGLDGERRPTATAAPAVLGQKLISESILFSVGQSVLPLNKVSL